MTLQRAVPAVFSADVTIGYSTTELLIAGIVDIVIAGLIISGLPGSATWAIGLLAGVNLLFGGATLIGMALAARNA